MVTTPGTGGGPGGAFYFGGEVVRVGGYHACRCSYKGGRGLARCFIKLIYYFKL